jgi:glutamate dehydrogenase (NAD(P)+)
MTKRWEEYSKHKVLQAIEKSTGLRIAMSHTEEVDKLLEGPTEVHYC